MFLTQSPVSVARPRPKATVLVAYMLCPVLLSISCYGFWQWFKLPSDSHLVGLAELYYLMALVIIPLVLFLFLSVTAAQRLEYNRLSGSYQQRMDQLQKRLNLQEDLLHMITNQDPEAIAIIDQRDRYWFANVAAASEAHMDVSDMIGKTLDRVLKLDEQHNLEARLQKVRQTRQALRTLDQRVDSKDGTTRFVQTHFEPLRALGEFEGGILMRAEDVTTLIVEREKRENMLRQVIAAMVAVVDRRDPYATGHSQRVGQLSRMLAEELMLGEREIETAEIAGSLMNFGKVLVPREILTKTSALTAEELQRVRDSIQISADILSIINFQGPVVQTLRQVQERYDGSGGPHGLRGEDILICARIVAVSNAFVAMTSPRAHRPSLEFRDAVRTMMVDADKFYDRKVVTALANCLDNRASKLDWLRVGKTV